MLLAIPVLRHWTVWGLLSLALAAMLAGGLMVGWRRRVEKPPELSKGRFSRLPFALLAYAAAFLVVALDQAAGGVLPWPLSLALVLVGAWGCAELVLGVWKGPLKHAVHGALHLVAHPRPERFQDGFGRDTALRPLDLDTNGKLGAERPVDFDWNRLLGFDACVQCGRCETACPAYAAGLPLNPKKLIQDLVTALEEGADDSSYAGNGHPGRPLGLAHGGPIQPVIGPMVHPDTLWACTTCRACVQECPMMIEHVDAVIDLRRFQTLELGATPGKAAGVLEELKATDNPGGRPLSRRLDWAVDLEPPRAGRQGPVRRAALARRRRLRPAHPALAPRPGPAAAPRRDRLRGPGSRGTGLRRRRPAARRRGHIPGSGNAQRLHVAPLQRSTASSPPTPMRCTRSATSTSPSASTPPSSTTPPSCWSSWKPAS